jgi:hypothetical protein
MSDPVWALQKAMYTALDGALSVPVYDDVPSTAVMPYVAFDSFQASPNDPLASRRDVVMVYLTAWTKGRGRKDAQALLNTIYDTLHQSKLTLDAGRNVRCYVTRRSTNPDIADQVFAGQVTVRCIVEH